MSAMMSVYERETYAMQRALTQLRWARGFQSEDQRGGTDEVIELLRDALAKRDHKGIPYGDGYDG